MTASYPPPYPSPNSKFVLRMLLGPVPDYHPFRKPLPVPSFPSPVILSTAHLSLDPRQL
jgi:hypothetical protein